MGLREALTRGPGWLRWIAGITALRFVFAALVPLSPEEAYHWNYAAHLDWSYFDHPPMIAWSIAAGRLILGDTPLGVRLVPILFSAGTAILLSGMAGRLYGERAKVWTVWLLALEPLVLGISGSAFPDSPLLFFWTLALTLTWQAIESGRWGSWLGAGAALGAAHLSKYTAVFFGLGVLIYLLESGRHRFRLATLRPYGAALAALAIFLPVVLWNASHDWVSFRFQSVDRFQGADEVKLLGPLKFLGQQGLGVLFLLFPVAGVAAWRAAHSARPEERFLFWLCVPLLAFLFLVSSIRGIHLLWPLPAYLGLTVLMAGVIVRGETAVARFYESRKAWFLGAYSVGVVAMTCHAVLFLPFLSPIQGLYGWKEVAQEARRLRDGMAPGTFVVGVGRKYTVTSQLAFHLRDPENVHGRNLLGQGGLQYDFWSDVPELAGRDAVVVVEADDRLETVVERIHALFRSVEPAGEVAVPIGRHPLLPARPVRFALFRAHEFNPPVDYPVKIASPK